MNNTEKQWKKIVALSLQKQRLHFPGSDIYGGLAKYLGLRSAGFKDLK